MPNGQDGGGPVFRDLMRRNDAALTNMDASDWTGAGGRPGGYGAIEVDGLTEYVSVPSAVVAGVPATMGGWAKVNTIGAEIYTLFAMGTAASATDILRLYVQTNGAFDRYATQQYDGSTAGDAFSTTPVVANVGTWMHLLAVFTSDSSRTIYVNGVAEDTDTTAVTALTTQDYTQFGRLDWGGGPIQFFEGWIDDVRIYDRALSAQEVSALYRESKAGYPRALAWQRPGVYLPVAAPAGGPIAGRHYPRGVMRGELRGVV